MTQTDMRKILTIIALGAAAVALACTSALVGPSRTADGLLIMWKHRDTGAPDNFLERVEPRQAGDKYGYVGLFNGGDTLLTEAWMGVNDAGFAIMNTASYNLAPDTARLKDQEGMVMARALAVCATVEDFKTLLDTLVHGADGLQHRPMGVQANFAVADSMGNAAYLETDDYTYKVYPLSEAADDVLIRTNHSLSGDPEQGGMGYARYEAAECLLTPYLQGHDIRPETFTDTISRSFYHGLIEKDFLADTTMHWAVDQDFIPRYISTASIAIEVGGNLPPRIWAALGYPPVAKTIETSIDSVAEDLRPTLPGGHAPANAMADVLKQRIFPLTRGNGRKYINLDAIRQIYTQGIDKVYPVDINATTNDTKK